MATTNIDAVAEFKILTNAYQAEYGRAVGGQLQVVTKSGTQAFHGSGYWYGRRSDWNANYLDQQAGGGTSAGGKRASSSSRRSRRATTTATPSAVRSSSRACSTPTRRSSSSSGARSTSGAPTRPPSARPGCPPPSSGPVTSRRASTPAATRSPTSATTTTGLPCSASNTSGCFQDGGVLGKIPAESPVRAGPRRPQHLPRRRTSRAGSGINFTSQDPDTRAAPRGPAAARLPGHATSGASRAAT